MQIDAEEAEGAYLRTGQRHVGHQKGKLQSELFLILYVIKRFYRECTYLFVESLVSIWR